MTTRASELNPEFTENVAGGVAALNAGRRQEARRLLARAVREDPRNATAWYWLSRCVDDMRQRGECLERVRRLDQSKAVSRRRTVSRVSATGHAGEPEMLRRVQDSGDGLPGKGDALTWPEKGKARRARVKLPGRKRLLWAALTLAVVAFACAIAPRAIWPAAQALTENNLRLEASGIVRVEEVLVASEYGGRIADLPAGEGEKVAAGDVVVRLDTALLDAQVEIARAAVDVVEAGLVQAQAGARPGQIAVAEAGLAQAEEARLMAMQAVSDTMALVENPQEIRMQIAVLQKQVEAEKLRLAQMLSLKDGAEIGKDLFLEAQDKIMEMGGPGHVIRIPIPDVPGAFYEFTVPSLPLGAHLAPNYWWQAWIGVNATAAQKEGLEASLNQLYAQRQNPRMLKAKADEALSALAQAEAQVAIVEAQLDALRAGATEEQIAALETRVAQARAGLASMVSQRDRMEISSPIDGFVLNVAAHPEEVVAPGATLLTVADLSEVRLTVYLPETQIGRVRVGQGVQVTVDSFPGRVFEGQVKHISDRAEFTPRNVATQEERVHLVFAVEIGLSNDDGALKPGMPADAVFVGQ